MGLYFLKRVATAILLVWVVATLIFLILHMVPGDPAELLLSQGGMAPDPAVVADLRSQLGLDRPLVEQYLHHLAGLLQGDFGASIQDGHSVAAEIALRLPRTLELIGAAALLSLLVGLPCGMVAALRAGRPVDRLLSTGAGIALSVPVFVVGTLSVLIFSQTLKLFPAGGFVSFTSDPAGHLIRLVGPATTIAVGLGAIVFRTTRSAVLEVIGRDFVRAAHAKGIAPLRVIGGAVLRNASVPILTVFALQIGTLLGGTVLVEYVFNWPGLSGYLVRSVEARDYPEVVGIVLVISSLFVLINLAVDLVQALIDPRVRTSR